MTDLGILNYFLGLKIINGYYLSQAKYAFNLLTQLGLIDSKTCTTPLELNYMLTPMDAIPLNDHILYRQLVRNLFYSIVTRPDISSCLDISYAIHIVSQFLSVPCSLHYIAVLCILRYIKGTLYHGIYFSTHSSLDLRAYSDANLADDPIDHRSTTGYCLFLGDSLISWHNKK